MSLRGTKPAPVDQGERLKLLLYGVAGVGKTMTAIKNFPKPYIIDTEQGTEHKQYKDAIVKAGGVVFPATTFDDVWKEINALRTEKHDFKTLVLDSSTTLYEQLCDEGMDKVGTGYNKYKSEYADRYFARLFRRILDKVGGLDMNVVVTAHAKDRWEKAERVGASADGWKKLDYAFDLVLELEKRGQKRVAIVRKTRVDQFPDGDVFDLTFDALVSRMGKDPLTRDAKPVEIASDDQVAKLKKLMAVLSISDDVKSKWLKKADVESFSDMPAALIVKCIDHCEKKLADANENGKEAKSA